MKTRISKIASGLWKFIRSFPGMVKVFVLRFGQVLSFFVLLNVYLGQKVLNRITKYKYFPKVLIRIFSPSLTWIYKRAIGANRISENSINRLNLIDLALRNMTFKKSRTLITIGGMALGVGAIVFLVSLGYGLQSLVVGRIARLDEMRQADVARQSGSKQKINDKTLADLKGIGNLELALPMVSVVGRVNFQNSISDMAVYGVTSDYLSQSAIKPIEGKIFDSNDLVVSVIEEQGEVAGEATEVAGGIFGNKTKDVVFTLSPDLWAKVRTGPSVNSGVIGYTKRMEGQRPGEQYWGSGYESDGDAGKAGVDSNGKSLGWWVKAEYPIWEIASCDPVTDLYCEQGKYRVVREEDGFQKYAVGYAAQSNLEVMIQEVSPVSVLGESTIIQDIYGDEILGENTASDSSMIDWVEIASESGMASAPTVKTIPLSGSAKREAVVNRAMLKILGIKDNEAVGKTFMASFIVTEDLLEDSTQKIESEPAEYKIVGVTPDEKAPLFYVPFIDLRSLGITNYSQVKVVVKNKSNLEKVRQSIESLGYSTASVADTVEQINSLFVTARTILALLGTVALAVASLGMFNTLTVSLLERTREVGLMKAMGMKSFEVRELFLTESMIMGFFGGLLGIFIGFVGGKLVGVLLSVFAIFKGVGWIDVSVIPTGFVAAVIFLSLTVGFTTGIYPARRATKISALNALRYE